MTMSWNLRRAASSAWRGVALFIYALLVIVSAGRMAYGADGEAGGLSKPDASQQKVQTGLATYYARRLHGRKTASGESHDNADLVAAHPTLPFGTRVRVTNTGNDKSVEVRVTDRGPSRQSRRKGIIIDLSRAAADRLEMKENGRIKVRIEVLHRPRRSR